jgi:hypothetical protein
VIWFALLIAGADPMMFGGPSLSLEKLAAAARRCGYKHVTLSKVSFGGTILALPVTEKAVDDPNLDCVIKWFVTHPKLNLGFIGNKADAP